MKIVHLVLDGTVGGGQQVALQLARRSQARGDDVLVVSPTPGRFVERLEREGIPVRVLEIRGALDAGAALRLRRLLRAERADVVHTHAHFSVNVVGRVAGRLAGARVVSHMHAVNVFRRHGAAAALQRALDNASARLCRWIVAVSDAVQASLVEQGYPAGRIRTVHNGVEPPAPATPAALEVPAGAPVLLTVGRLDTAKGHRTLVEAVALLRHADAVALVAGELPGPEPGLQRALERRAAELGVAGRVRLLGHRDDVSSLVAGADVVVVPSLAEAFGMAALEAMAGGAAVVASAVGGLPELIEDGLSGVLVPPGDARALAAAVDALLDDPDRRRALGEAARRRALTRFRAGEAADRVLALYAT